MRSRVAIAGACSLLAANGPAIYRVEAGAWARLYIPGLVQWIPFSSYGGLPRRQCSDAAWDVQIFLEEHIAQLEDGVVVLLDY